MEWNDCFFFAILTGENSFEFFLLFLLAWYPCWVSTLNTGILRSSWPGASCLKKQGDRIYKQYLFTAKKNMSKYVLRHKYMWVTSFTFYGFRRVNKKCVWIFRNFLMDVFLVREMREKFRWIFLFLNLPTFLWGASRGNWCCLSTWKYIAKQIILTEIFLPFFNYHR